MEWEGKTLLSTEKCYNVLIVASIDKTGIRAGPRLCQYRHQLRAGHINFATESFA